MAYQSDCVKDKAQIVLRVIVAGGALPRSVSGGPAVRCAVVTQWRYQSAHLRWQ